MFKWGQMKFTCIMVLVIHFFFFVLSEFDPKAKYHNIFVSGVRRRWSPARFWLDSIFCHNSPARFWLDCCDLGTHCDRTNWWESRKEDIFLRGVIVNVFHNAQREDMSLVKQSWVQRGKGKEMHWLKCRILSVIKKKTDTVVKNIFTIH